MAQDKVLFQTERVRQMYNKLMELSEDTNLLRSRIQAQVNSTSSELMGKGPVQQTQQLINRLTMEAEDLAEVVLKAINGVERVQRESMQESNKIFDKAAQLAKMHPGMRAKEQATQSNVSFPAFIGNDLRRFIERVRDLAQPDPLEQDPVVKELRNRLKIDGLPDRYRIEAETKLKEIFDARNYIVQAQKAYEVYKIFCNEKWMNEVHAEAEACRKVLRDMGIDEKYIDASTDLKRYFKGSALMACKYNPSVTIPVPIPDNEQYRLLLSLVIQGGNQAGWAKKQLEEINAITQTLLQTGGALIGKIRDRNGKGIWEQFGQLLLTAQQLGKYNLFPKYKDDIPPAQLSDGTKITISNSLNAVTKEYFMSKVLPTLDVKEQDFGYPYVPYVIWLLDTYGEGGKLSDQEKLEIALRVYTADKLKEFVESDHLLDQISNAAVREWNGAKKFGNSLLEIGTDLWSGLVSGLERRANDANNSVYDFINYSTLGIPELVGGIIEGTIEGAKTRADKWLDSPYDFANWLTIGTVGIIDGAFFPEDPSSKEHIYDVFGFGGILFSGPIIKAGINPGVTKLEPTVKFGEVKSSKVFTEGMENLLDDLLRKSTCSVDELKNYLKKFDEYSGSNYADEFSLSGKWPDEVQIPKDSKVLNPDGSIKWSEVPNGGYVLDKNGEAIKELFAPKPGDVIDRYGPPNGRYTSPVIDGKPYNYEQRSLPYIEDITKYHQYEVVGDFSKLEEYISSCTDSKLKTKIEAQIDRYYNGDYSKLVTNKGGIAEGFGSVGGGIQYELPLPVVWLEGLGILKEIK